MAGRANFRDEEWNLIRVGPVLVASGVSISDPSGLIGSLKEAYYGSGLMSLFSTHPPIAERVARLRAMRVT